MRFRDRVDAGRRLAFALADLADGQELVVLGLARGGVMVAEPVAAYLGAPLDVFVVPKLYREGSPPANVAGKVVVLVDDGLAVGASMRVAIEALRHRQAGRIVAAVPVSPLDARLKLGRLADRLVCLWTPEPFGGVSRWYESFPRTTDAQVQAALLRAAQRAAPTGNFGTSAWSC